MVVGSGFGGSVSALRLAEKGYRVLVLEAGRRFADDEFARTSWDLRRFLWAPRLGCFGIQRIHRLPDVTILAGAGVGGGSLVYANTLYRPDEAFYDDPQWRDITDWRAELAPAYDLASRMLGVTQNPTITPSDVAMRTVAEQMGVGHTFALTPVGVFFGDDAGRDRAGPLLRRRRPGPHRLHPVRRVHDRLPARREEHPGEELPATSPSSWAWRCGRSRRCAACARCPAGGRSRPSAPAPGSRGADPGHRHRRAGRARRRHLGDPAAAAPDARHRPAAAPVAAAR